MAVVGDKIPVIDSLVPHTTDTNVNLTNKHTPIQSSIPHGKDTYEFSSVMPQYQISIWGLCTIIQPNLLPFAQVGPPLPLIQLINADIIQKTGFTNYA